MKLILNDDNIYDVASEKVFKTSFYLNDYHNLPSTQKALKNFKNTKQYYQTFVSAKIESGVSFLILETDDFFEVHFANKNLYYVYIYKKTSLNLDVLEPPVVYKLHNGRLISQQENYYEDSLEDAFLLIDESGNKTFDYEKYAQQDFSDPYVKILNVVMNKDEMLNWWHVTGSINLASHLDGVTNPLSLKTSFSEDDLKKIKLMLKEKKIKMPQNDKFSLIRDNIIAPNGKLFSGGEFYLTTEWIKGEYTHTQEELIPLTEVDVKKILPNITEDKLQTLITPISIEKPTAESLEILSSKIEIQKEFKKCQEKKEKIKELKKIKKTFNFSGVKIPNVFIRSGLFDINFKRNKGKSSKFYELYSKKNNELIESLEMFYDVESLNQEDMLFYQKIVYEFFFRSYRYNKQKNVSVLSDVILNKNTLLEFFNKPMGGGSYRWIESVLKRLSTTKIVCKRTVQKNKVITYSGYLINVKLTDTPFERNKSFIVSIDNDIQKLMCKSFTYINFSNKETTGLKTQLSKFLYDYYSTHKNFVPIDINYMKTDICRSDMRSDRFIKALKDAISSINNCPMKPCSLGISNGKVVVVTEK